MEASNAIWEKRPSDPIAPAAMIGRIATSEVGDIETKKPAKARSGKARAASLTSAERSNIAVKAASARLGQGRVIVSKSSVNLKGGQPGDVGKPNWANQTIWTGDNLETMRGMNSASVDLIYLDPLYMAISIMEMKRLLKPTGSIYLHCDPTVSHYLKLLIDSIFGLRAAPGSF